MALALDYHNAYAGHGDPSVTSYPGVREEPGPAPSLRELVECCTRGRVDSDPEVSLYVMAVLTLRMFFLPEIRRLCRVCASHKCVALRGSSGVIFCLDYVGRSRRLGHS